MSSGPVDDFTFLMTCIVHSTGEFPKPDFEKVAAQIGAKNARSCYLRLWNIKKNWGKTSSGAKKVASKTLGTPSSDAAAASGSAGGKKRGRPAKVVGTEPVAITKKAAVGNRAEHAGGGDDGDDDESLIDTPFKKPKIEQDDPDIKQEIVSVHDDTDDQAKENGTG